MTITTRRLQGTTVLELHGTLTDAAATELLDATVRWSTRTGSQRLVLHLWDVPSIDAAGLGSLASAYGVVRRNGGTIRLAQVTRRVRVLLAVCRLTTVLETFDSVEAALADGAGAGEAASTTSPRVLQVSRTRLDLQPTLQRA